MSSVERLARNRTVLQKGIRAMINSTEIRPERVDKVTCRLLDGNRAVNDIAIIDIEAADLKDRATFYFPFDQEYDEQRMTLGRFADRIHILVDELFSLREAAHQRREEAEEERHESSLQSFKEA